MGFEGLSEQQSFGRRPYTFPMGFRGISEQIPDNTRFIKVVSYRQIPMANVEITVHNTGGDEMATTNSEGIATIYPDPGEVILLDLQQYKTRLNDVSYDTDNEDVVKTVILDTLMHIL